MLKQKTSDCKNLICMFKSPGWEKTWKNVSSCTRIVMPFNPKGNKVIRSQLVKFQTCTSLSSYSSLYKVYKHYYNITLKIGLKILES